MVAERWSDADRERLARDKFPIWTACGADGQVLAGTAAQTDGPLADPDARNGWVARFMALGDQCRDQARSPAVREAQKATLYGKAALYYGIAKYPATETRKKQEAYARQQAMLEEGSRHVPYTFRKERIPYGSKEIIASCYEPKPEKEITLPEAVLLMGDIDCTKEDLHPIATRIAGAGMVCLALDLPGTGESAWKLEPPGGNEVHSVALKHLAGSGTCNPSRIGMMGVGFGGYWALVAASTCPEVKAAVNCAGPVHKAFSQESLKQLPALWKVALTSALGCPAGDFDKALGRLGEFSLFKREDLRRISCPLLSLNGSDDPYVPIGDLFAIAEEGGVRQEEWVYREDVHLAPGQFDVWMPRAVAWIANQIGGKERIPRPDLATL